MQVLIHSKLDLNPDLIKNCKVIDVTYTDNFEQDVIIEIDPKINEELDFEEFTEYFGIPYHLVNCIEAHDFCAVWIS